MNNFPKNFIDAIKSKECIFFIGSGVSMWSNYPSWHNLIQDMLQFLCERGMNDEEAREIRLVINSGDLITAANLCLSCMRNEEFQVFVDKEFRKDEVIHEVHKLIVDLGVDSFITTNYDKLIETAFLKIHDTNLHLINNKQSIEHGKIVKAGSSRFIFKLHGDIDDTESMILSTRDYKKIKYELGSVMNTLENLLLSRPVVYLGFGLKDPDFLMVKEKISSTYKGGEREHFAILPEVGKLQKSLLREEYGITVIPYNVTLNKMTESGSNYSIKNHEEFILLLRELYKIIHNDPDKSTLLTGEKINIKSYLKISVLRYFEEIKYKTRKDEGFHFTLNISINKDSSKSFKENTSKEDWILVNSYKIVNIFEAFDKVNNLIIIGPPGSGKTYSITKFSAILADRTTQVLNSISNVSKVNLKQAIPVLLPMKEYKGDIQKMIFERIPRSVKLDTALQGGYFVLLFDAIDEISREFSDNNIFSSDIENLYNNFPGNRFIFTSRSLMSIPDLGIPVFETMPLSFDNVKEAIHIKDLLEISGDIPSQTKEIIQNPLFLSLLLKSNAKRQAMTLSLVELLNEYFAEMNIIFAREIGISDVQLQRVLAPVCFDAINQGQKIISLEMIIASARRVFELYPEQIEKTPRILISLGILVADNEGGLGFIHQTVLEFLAATHLAEQYHSNPLILDEKVSFYNWDETIMLFFSLIPNQEFKALLDKLASRDIKYACKAFSYSAIKTDELREVLFNYIFEKSTDSMTPKSEKFDLKNALLLLETYDDYEKLIVLLDEEEIAEGAAILLSKIKNKEAIPKIINLLLNCNKWPNDFSKALINYDDEMIALELLKAINDIDIDSGLVINNIANVLAEYESDVLYEELINLSKSNLSLNRKIAVEILENIGSEYSISILEQMLNDSDPDVLWHIIFCFSGSFGRQVVKNDNIITKMFELLKDEKIGNMAADYLATVFDDQIYKQSLRKLINPNNDFEKINLCHIIAIKEPEIVIQELFNYLDNYDSRYHEPLYEALRNVDLTDVFDNFFKYLYIENKDLRLTILMVIRSGNRKGYISGINKEKCEYLFRLWEQANSIDEEQSIRMILGNEFIQPKEIALKKFNNPEYRFRHKITDIVARYSLTTSDFTDESIDWLIANIAKKTNFWNPVPYILGQICSEELAKKKILPMLESDNLEIKDQAYITVRQAEKKLGKRIK